MCWIPGAIEIHTDNGRQKKIYILTYLHGPSFLPHRILGLFMMGQNIEPGDNEIFLRKLGYTLCILTPKNSKSPNTFQMICCTDTHLKQGSLDFYFCQLFSEFDKQKGLHNGITLNKIWSPSNKRNYFIAPFTY